MNTEELFLLQKEVSRLLEDYCRCSDPIYKELIGQDVLFLCSVIAKQQGPEN